MDGQRFDGLARRFATATSRRRFLRGLVGGAAGSFVMARGNAAPDAASQNADCAQFCQQLPPGPERGQCVADAAAGTGLCFQCGPAASDPAQELCDGACVDTDTDTQHCGLCDQVCDPGEICDLGTCATPCPAGQTPCGGMCVSLAADPDNCGFCDNVCVFANASATCVAGTCALGACAGGFGNCNGNPSDGCETNLSDDLGNCGGCNVVCPTPANATPTCEDGECGFVCLAGFGNCDGNPATGCERNLQTDPDHCGGCGIDCPSGPNEAPTCADGECGTDCVAGFSRCGTAETCCPDGFCLNGTCVGGVCGLGSVGCNPGPVHCVCLGSYAGPTVCTPAFGAFCSAQRCNAGDPANTCPTGSFCIPTSCDGPAPAPIVGRCAPVGACPTGSPGCGDVCVTGETCKADGFCSAP